MKSIIAKIKIDFFVVLLLLIALVIVVQNYTPGTILSGWDTLHPEFNFKLYLERISSVWQTHQGLGAPPSQAHLTELPRMLIVGLFYLFLPLNLVRYSYFFLIIILGPIGIYLLLNYIFKSEDKAAGLGEKISAFLGALFYLLNVGTMQHFIAPLEMFATKFGFLGFLYLYSLKFINEGKKKHLIIFSIITVFASSMAHTATLWYVYFFGYILFLGVYSLLGKKGWKKTFKKSLLLIFLTLILNLYWIMPNLYYGINHGSEMMNSKINRQSTTEFYFYNKKYGKISDLLLFKNFLFDWRITNNDLKTNYLLSAWKNHLDLPNIKFIAYTLSIIAIGGMFMAVWKRKTVFTALVPMTLISAGFLLSDMPIASQLFDWIRNAHPILKELLRFPFTKFSIYYIFGISLFFAYSHKIILNNIKQTKLSLVYFYLLTLIILVYSTPSFQGNFISQVVRVKIPDEYFSLFAWSKNNNQARILNLPVHSLFGWVYYQWNQPEGTQVYQGAGFTWFGLDQPTLNREFDRWYPYNEQSFKEISYAVYSKNLPLFEALLEKYNIQYILLDENVFIPEDNNQQKKLFYSEIKQLLASSGKITLNQRFSEKLAVFEYLPNRSSQAIKVLSHYQEVTPQYRWNYLDQAYLDYGPYITHLDSSAQNNRLTTYPARNILNEKERINKDILKISNDSYQVQISSQKNSQGTLIIPSILETESEFYADIFAQKSGKEIKIKINYLLPYVSHIPQSEIIIKEKQYDQFYLANKIFYIPELIDESPIYLGEVLLSIKEQYTLDFLKNNQKRIAKYELSLAPINLSLASNAYLNENSIKGDFPQEQIKININSIQGQFNDCNYEKSLFINKHLIKINDAETIEYQAKNGDICDRLAFPELSHNLGYILAIESKNISGLPIKLCFENSTSKKCDFEDELSINKNFSVDYFVIPPLHNGSGYNLVLSNFSVGDLLTTNQLKSIRIIPFPFNFFQSIKWETQGQANSQSKLLFFNTAYEKGWAAFYAPKWIVSNPILKYFSPIFGQKIKDHVLVNNWANGWRINDNQNNLLNISIIFLPQYLEYLGFGLLILAFVLISL